MLKAARYREIAEQFDQLRIAIVGDFCLDRYLEIDPRREEVSIETGLAVHNVVNVRSQPGGAGTILNNLAALGVGEISPVGFCGADGEGFELTRALAQLPGTRMDAFIETPLRSTFTYCKPLKLTVNGPPEELNRLDSKNWTPTPCEVTDELLRHLDAMVDSVDAIILLDQVDVAETGVVTSGVLDRIAQIAAARPELWIIADSRRGLKTFPPVCFKMNAGELARMTGEGGPLDVEQASRLAVQLAQRNARHVFVTMNEQGMLGAAPDGTIQQTAALPTRGPIDIVGAGDCVTANLTTALAAGATLAESLRIASIAAHVVIHQLGTTGTATVTQIHGHIQIDPGEV